MHVEERSPAERADWRPGDLMVTVVGEPVVDVIAAVGVVTRREGV